MPPSPFMSPERYSSHCRSCVSRSRPRTTWRRSRSTPCGSRRRGRSDVQATRRRTRGRGCSDHPNARWCSMSRTQSSRDQRCSCSRRSCSRQIVPEVMFLRAENSVFQAADVLVLHDRGIRDSALPVTLLIRFVVHRARASAACERRLRCRQVGVDVIHAVDVAVIDEFRRAVPQGSRWSTATFERHTCGNLKSGSVSASLAVAGAPVTFVGL